jgi:hypothetical protein
VPFSYSLDGAREPPGNAGRATPEGGVTVPRATAGDAARAGAMGTTLADRDAAGAFFESPQMS